MPSESELRRILREGAGDPNVLDPALIIRKARARRRPKQFVAGTTGVLAAAALLVPVTLGGAFSTAWGPASDSVAGGAASDESAVTMEEDAARGALESAPMDAETSLLCGAPTPGHAAHPDGLTISISGAHDTGGASATVIVAITNSGDRFSGTIDDLPTVALVRDDAVVATTSRGTSLEQVPLELAPGATMLLEVPLELSQCDPAGGEALGPLASGDYLVTATLDAASTAGSAGLLTALPSLYRLP